MRKVLLGMAVLLMAAGAVLAADKADFAQKYRVGDWAVYRIMGVSNYHQRHSIVAIDGEGDDATVTFRVVNIVDGKEKGKPAEFTKTVAQLRDEDERTMSKISRKETVKVGDREIEADVVVETKDGKEVTFYGSDSIPVTGVIRMQETGKPPISDLLDFGRGGED